ncbi:MAG: hypothetical protein ABIP41_09175 [Croceibacterium sp.]
MRRGACRRVAGAATCAALALLAACGRSDTDQAPGGVTVGETRAVDEAAEMLGQQRHPVATPSATPQPRPSPKGA